MIGQYWYLVIGQYWYLIIDVITKLLVNWVLRGVAQEGLSQLQVGLMLSKFQFKFPK
jgi:fucose 4-O-acetylase-like acetyltransferase